MFAFLLIPFLVGSSIAQDHDTGTDLNRDTLAIVDNSAITALDLFERIQMMPFEAKMRDRDFESVKRKAVESLVGERLLSLSAPVVPDSEQWRLETMNAVLLKMFTRDAMYRKEIHDRAKVPDQEVLRNLHKYAVRRQLLAVTQPSVEAAKKFSAEWRRRRSSGESNTQIISTTGRQPDTLYISLGSIDPPLEEAAFAIKDTMEVSGPVHSKTLGVVVMSLLADEPSAEASGKSVQQRERAVRDILTDRKEETLKQVFIDRLFHGQGMKADSALFLLLSRKLWEIMRSDSSARRVPGGFRYLPDDVNRLLDENHSIRNKPVVGGSFGILSVGEFLEGLLHYDYVFPSLKGAPFAKAFFDILRAMTEAEIIAREGLRRGYQYSPEVEHDLAIWSDYWRSRSAEGSIVDTVRIKPSDTYMSLWKFNAALVETSCALSVQEILRPDSASAVAILMQLREGIDMDSLARVYSMRSDWKEKGGRSGWFFCKEKWELAGYALQMSMKEITGPVKLTEGFSIVKVLGRKFVGETARSVLSLEAQRVRMAQQQRVLNEQLAQRAMAHNVRIFYDRIPPADVANIDMFTRRLLGFGGKINAAPLLIPQWEWVDEWKKMQKRVP